MLEWSVATLRSIAAIERIVVALPADALDAAPEGTVAVAGGAARSHSVREALRVAGADAVIAAAPVSDTIKEVGGDGRTVARTLDRSRLWAVQTPQVFRRAALERVFGGAADELLAAATDDAWLIERAGGTVAVVESGARNIKITTSTDFKLAELLLAEGESARAAGAGAGGAP